MHCNVRPRFSQVPLTDCQTIWKTEKKPGKAWKSLEKLAQVCKSWQRLAGPRKSWQVKICTEIPSISFPGVKLIKWSAFSLSDSFDDQGLTSSLGFEFVSLRTSKRREAFSQYIWPCIFELLSVRRWVLQHPGGWRSSGD